MHFFRVFSKKNKRHAITTVGADMHLSLECVKLIKIIFENIPILHGSGMNTYPLRSKMTHLFAYCHYSRKIWVGVRQWTVGRFMGVWAHFDEVSHWRRAVANTDNMPIRTVRSLI